MAEKKNAQSYNLPRLTQQISPAENVPTETMIIPLDGRLITNADPTIIGKNFQSLKNMRYGEGHPEGILGMAKVNTTALSNYPKVRSAFFFRNAAYGESHLLVQGYNSGLTQSKIFENTTAIPNQGDYTASEIWSDSSGADIGMFSDAPQGQVAYCNGVDTCIWGGVESRCAAFITSTATLSAVDDTVTDPRDYTTRINNRATDEDNVVTIGGDQKYFLIASTRPAQGAKLYISSANATSNTLSAKYFTGGEWTALTISSDGTADGGASLAQTGVVTWGDTSTTSVLKYIEGYYLHWYLLSIDAGSADISHVTLDVPFQRISDVWDGTFSEIAAAYQTKPFWPFNKADVVFKLREYNYDKDDDNTYVNMNAIATDYIEVGFTQRQTALFFAIPAFYNNSNRTTIQVFYWNGKKYTSVGTVTDGTAEDGKSFATVGVVSWTNANISDEVKHSVAGGSPYYYYAITFTGIIDITTRLYYVGGVPVANSISSFSFPLMAAERLMLGCDNYENQNLLKISAQSRPDVFNGDDAFDILIGDDKPLRCGCSIFAQYSSNVYNLVLLFKDQETWSLYWDQSSEGVVFSRYRISPSIGCPAPRTLHTVSVVAEKNINQTKVVAIWRGNNGIYVSNGQAPFEVSGDISDVFDQSSSTHVNLSMTEQEVGFVDYDRMEFHWLWASNTSTSLDKEYVLDLQEWRWYEVDRTSGKRLQCGVSVYSSNGAYYGYGFIDTGYTELLESGTTFDGEDITCTLHFGDILPAGNIAIETDISAFNLIAKPKNTDSSVTLTHYIDGDPTGNNYTLSVAESSKRLVNIVQDIYSSPGVFHSFKFTVTTDDETRGFEPLHCAVRFEKVREHTR